MHTVEVYEGHTNQQTQEKSWVRAFQNGFPSLEAAQKYAARNLLPFRRVIITDTKLSVVYDSLTSDGNSPAEPTAQQPRRTMPRRPQPVSTSPTITLAVYGTGASSTENTTALLDDLIEGLQPCTPKFVIPVGKVTYTDAISDVRTYALDKGYEYVAVHHEPVGRTKALKEALDGAASVSKGEDTAQEILDIVGKARDARLLFFWQEDDSLDAEDEQRLLNAVLAADVVALDVAQGMEPIAPDDGEGSDKEEVFVGADEEPEYDVFITWSARRQRSFAYFIGYTEEDVAKDADPKDVQALLYPEETAAAADAPPRSGKEIRKEIEADKAKEEAAAAAEKPAATKRAPRGTTAAKDAPEPADEAQAGISAEEQQTVTEFSGLLADAIAESLADLIFDKVIERLQARAKEATKDDIVRDLVPPRRPGRPTKD